MKSHLGRASLAALYLDPSLRSLLETVDQNHAEKDELLEVLAFEGEPKPVFGEPFGTGLSGRRIYDLSQIDAEAGVSAPGKHYIRTRAPQALDPIRTAAWRILVSGFAAERREIGIAELRERSERQGPLVMECAGNGPHRAFGLLSAATWSGVRLDELLEELGGTDEEKLVMVLGNDNHRLLGPGQTGEKAWIFKPADLVASSAFLATEMNSEEIPPDHGSPVRLMIPGWYGCSCIKWVEEIRLLPAAASSTLHMRDYAGRTHQDAVPELARDFKPAVMDLAAMPTRVERRRGAAGIYYRVIGIMWGGQELTDRLSIRFGDEGKFAAVQSYEHLQNRSWTRWEHSWQPKAAGLVPIRLIVQDESFPTNRLDEGYYSRSVRIKEV